MTNNSGELSKSLSDKVAAVGFDFETKTAPERCGAKYLPGKSNRKGRVDVAASGSTASEDMLSTSTPDTFEMYRILRRDAERCFQGNLCFQSEHITLNMRSILIDWLIEVAEEYELMPETLFLSVECIDRCLRLMPIERRRLQLVGITCLFIAAKYEEIYAPQVDDLCYITDSSYDRNQILDMERQVLGCLNFSLTVPTTNTFLSVYLEWSQAEGTQAFLAGLLSELTLLNGQFLMFPSFINAAAAVFLARFYLHHSASSVLEFLRDLDDKQLALCVDALHRDFTNYDSSNFSAIHEKYSDMKYGRVRNVSSKKDPIDHLNAARYLSCKAQNSN